MENRKFNRNIKTVFKSANVERIFTCKEILDKIDFVMSHMNVGQDTVLETHAFWDMLFLVIPLSGLWLGEGGGSCFSCSVVRAPGLAYQKQAEPPLHSTLADHIICIHNLQSPQGLSCFHKGGARVGPEVWIIGLRHLII